MVSWEGTSRNEKRSHHANAKRLTTVSSIAYPGPVKRYAATTVVISIESTVNKDVRFDSIAGWLPFIGLLKYLWQGGS